VPSKISGYNATQPLAPVKGVAADKAAVDDTSTAAQAAKSTDHLTLTESARSLQKIGEAIAKAPVVNATKVAAVKQALSSGSYQIDAGRVADGLLQFERGLK
jgi:negative regulator of flagellin synthesis FlgM